MSKYYFQDLQTFLDKADNVISALQDVVDALNDPDNGLAALVGAIHDVEGAVNALKDDISGNITDIKDAAQSIDGKL